ncbi:MAG: 30S ribosomal protein S16 [Planctomycetota bacterium]|nr:MAG: 30S ribosomal protein S16 [Planctomycetota bacterium]REJ95582.1 MAG: 30S ribosomal protein S16 [Planctomycetota bacterium]REK21989.1 MAG: 30S ribosomal protein S16 [Planctomycetota bacterium]REK31263.1 MAG: 30S ribosomal protein S16 [Planctomycetota bacterium]
MSVRIRLKRLGRKHRPFYRICVMDQRAPRDGRAIEEIGHYDPMVRDKSKRVVVSLDRVDHWLSVGAQPSEKVAVLIRKVKEGNWGVAKEPPPMKPPQEPKPEAPPEEEASAEEGASGEGDAAAEEAPAEESASSE